MARVGAVEMDVKGIKELQRTLQRLKPSLQRKAIRPAVQACATLVAKAARQLAPTGTGQAKEKGKTRKRLKRTIATRTKTYANGSIVGIIGSRSREAPHGHLVEGGTQPHIIPGPVSINGKIRTFNVKHPGSKPRHWLSNALKNTSSQQRAIFTTKLAAGIEKVAAAEAKKIPF